jgi:hypothetical protein
MHPATQIAPANNSAGELRLDPFTIFIRQVAAQNDASSIVFLELTLL